jgi:hypothetical protein
MLDRFEEMVLNLQGSHHARRLRDRKRFFAGVVLQLSRSRHQLLWLAAAMVPPEALCFVKEFTSFTALCDFCFDKKIKK